MNKRYLFFLIIFLSVIVPVNSTIDEFGFEEDFDEFEGYIIEFKSPPLIQSYIDFAQASGEPSGVSSNRARSREILDAQKRTISSEKERGLNKIAKALGKQVSPSPSGLTGNSILETNSLFGKLTGFVTKRNVPELEILDSFDSVLNGVVLNITAKEVAKLNKISEISSISPDYKVESLLSESVSLIQGGVLAGRFDRNGNDCLTSGEECLTGKGVTIGIIDSGVDYKHIDLGGCTKEQFLSRSCSKVIGGYDFVNKDNDPMDDRGHGTHVAATAAGNGVLKGVAPEATIYAYKVLNNEGSGKFSNTLKAIEWSVDPNRDGDYSDKLDIISLSLGSPYGSPDFINSRAIDRVASLGVVAVVAAGNGGPGLQTIATPGSARDAITVGSISNANNLSSFSSRGPVVWKVNKKELRINKPDILAPGAQICAAQSSNNPWNDKRCLDQDHVSISGTSMATPHVSGAIALLKEKHPDWTPVEIKNSLKGTAEDLGYSIISQGAGKIDVGALIALDSPLPPKAYLTLEKIGRGSGEVVSVPEGVSCGSDCASYFFNNSQINLSAIPNEGSQFVGWVTSSPLVGCSGNGECISSVKSDILIKANFEVMPFDFSITNEYGNSDLLFSNQNSVFNSISISSNSQQVKEKVSLSLSGVPNGLSYKLSKSSCTPDCESRLELKKIKNKVVSPGEYEITINAKSQKSKIQKISKFKLIVS